MEKRIRDRFNEDILAKARSRYGIKESLCKPLGGFESFIYEFECDGSKYILRIAHSIRRNGNLISAEVDWINFLADGGTSVASAILSNRGNLVESIDDGAGGLFLATAFVKIKGEPLHKVEWTDQINETYGKLLGKMHALSMSYEPSNPVWRRPDWDDPIMLDVEAHLPDSDEKVRTVYQSLLAYINTLPRDKSDYGLIHQDAHAGNIFIDKTEKITIFDFDDSAYSWFINDIAIVLFYAVLGKEDIKEFTVEFMKHFLQGYQQENQFNPVWLKEIPHFLKLREVDLYAVIHRSFDVNNLTDPWCAMYMDGRKEKIENNVPFIDFNFENLKSFL